MPVFRDKSRAFLSLLFCGLCMLEQPAAFSTALPIEGRWDLTFDMDGVARPGWLEVEKSGNGTLVGRVMVISGSARPISEITYDEGIYSFGIPVQWERGQALVFTARLAENTLAGTMVYADGKTYDWSGGRAPVLHRTGEPEWGPPVNLFNGHDLSGWTTQHPTDVNQWVAEDGIFRSPASGANLMTEELFEDFKLHIEFRYPANSNSGIYLRGRYEVQITDNYGLDPSSHYFGGVYGLLTPNEMAARPAGEWQEYDITLIGRRLTIIANGIEIICNQDIPGPTGGAIDSREGEPGPILLQGDHGPVEFRNVVLRKGR